MTLHCVQVQHGCVGGGRHQSQRFTLKLRSPGETTTVVAYILQDWLLHHA